MNDPHRATTATGRPLHKDDPIEAWDEAAARINAHTVAQGRQPETHLTGEVLRQRTMLADELIGEMLADEAAVLAAFERHGFKVTHTHGNCTALVRQLEDGSEIFLTAENDAYVPYSLDERVLVAFMPMGREGHPECEHTAEWHGTGAEYLSILDRMASMKDALVVGAAVRLVNDVERFPHFIAPAGMTGRVVMKDDDSICIRMDAHLEGAQEWNNEIVWEPRDAYNATWFDYEFFGEVEIVKAATVLDGGAS